MDYLKIMYNIDENTSSDFIKLVNDFESWINGEGTFEYEREFLDIQNKIYTLMAEKGWYTMDTAEQQKIDQLKNNLGQQL